MFRIKVIIISLSSLLILSCKKDNSNEPADCSNDNSLNVIQQRKFKMGFSTWSFGPNTSDKEATYQFISNNSDIYSEQIDNKIPWSAWVNNTPLPIEFTNEIAYRVSKKIKSHQLLLSVSLLNTDRSDLLEDFDGTIPSYSALNEKIIEDAYFLHLKYLIDNLQPDYLVLAMEVNDLRLKSETKWNEYKLLMNNIRSRIKGAFPELFISESVTLHNWYSPEVSNPAGYIQEISDYVNQLDFIAISYYPLFKGQHTKKEFQEAFNFLHSKATKPIAFVETSHLANTIEIPSYNLKIESDVCEQKDYLETLLLNANNNNYKFIIWWAFRDFDALWQTFPDEYKDIGKLWRDTGLLDENGTERPAYTVWTKIFNK